MSNRPLPRFVAALVAVLLSLPGANATAQTQEELERSRAQLRDAQQGLADTEGRRRATLEDLQQIEARRAQVEGELSALNRTLAAAEGRLAAAEAKLREVAAELARTRAELDETERELERNRRRFDARVRETFKRGNTAYSFFSMDVGDINEFARGMNYLERVMRTDRDRITEVASLQRQVEAEEAALDLLGQRQALLTEAAQRERDQVVALVADQRVLRDRAAVEAERHRVALADIESDRDEYAALVTSLEQESDRLEAELRRRAEEERRRREAEEAARASRGDRDAGAGDTGSAALARPYSGPQTSGYGWREHPIYGERRFHAGVDYAGPTGDGFWAAGDGVVVSAGWRGGYGNAVVIDHGGGIATLYAHASALRVRAGERVTRGQIIGEIGSTGYSTGPHLHFEVREDGEPRDPDRYV